MPKKPPLISKVAFNFIYTFKEIVLCVSYVSGGFTYVRIMSELTLTQLIGLLERY